MACGSTASRRSSSHIRKGVGRSVVAANGNGGGGSVRWLRVGEAEEGEGVQRVRERREGL